MEFTDYILELSKTTTSFIDIYVEISLFKKFDNQYTNRIHHFTIESFIKELIFDTMLKNKQIKNFNENYLDYINNIMHLSFESTSYTFDTFFSNLIECIQPSTRDVDKCKLIRIHSIDPRTQFNVTEIQSIDYLNIITIILNSQLINYPQQLELIKYTGSQIALTKIFTNVNNSNTNKKNIEIITFNIYQFINNSKIDDEIEKTYKRPEIINFINEEIELLIIKYLNIVDDMNKFINDINNNNNKNTVNLINIKLFIQDLGAIMMDLYTLCRMFKLHENTRSKQYIDNESERKQAEPTQPIESTNVIYYAGADHTRRIYKFLLKQNGYSQIYKDDLATNDCVKMKDNVLRVPTNFISLRALKSKKRLNRKK